MTLNPEQRARLLARANELRTEVSALTSERDAAFAESAAAVADAKLLAEVAGLQRQRDAAAEQRDAAVNSTEDALLLMQEAIETQVETAILQNAGSTEPDRAGAAEAADKLDVSEAASSKEGAEQRLEDNASAPTEAEAVPAQQDASAQVAPTPKNIKGGNR
jgi:hypothetical protein